MRNRNCRGCPRCRMRVAGGQQELEGLPRLEAIRDRHRHLSRRRFHLQALTTAHACRNSDLHLLALLSQGLGRLVMERGLLSRVRDHARVMPNPH